MKKYVEIFKEIKNESSRKGKEELLRKYENVEGLKEIFKFVYDPLVKTGLAKKKIEKEVSLSTYTQLETIFDAMDYTILYNTGSDQIIQSIQIFLKQLKTEEERELAKSILTKDLPIGISSTTLNRVYGKGFINKHKVMKGQKYNPKKHLTKGEEFIVSLKVDGFRSTTKNLEEGSEFITTTGAKYEGLVELEELMKKLPTGFVYEGELVNVNRDNLSSSDLFRETQSRLKKHGIKKDIRLLLFDMIPIDDYEKGIFDVPYKTRRAFLEETIKNSLPTDSLISAIPKFYVGNKKDVIDDLFLEAIGRGEEGLMIHLSDGIFELKKSPNLLKVKPEEEADLRCLDVVEDIRGGKCGSIIVDYKGHRVAVAGLKEKWKIDFWKDPSLVIGKIVEIKYFQESKNEHGSLSLRHPSLNRIRNDKDEVSYS
ncbi:hypothetical protein [Bacillus sp. Bos-x628]|uniref:ATP-dependent DNA ligase n=1 Tax=Bacillus maqinnsis TaxID=3229854 RepID=UPI00338DA86B